MLSRAPARGPVGRGTAWVSGSPSDRLTLRRALLALRADMVNHAVRTIQVNKLGREHFM